MGLYDRDYTQADFQSQQRYTPQMRLNFPRLTPVVKWLLILNIGMAITALGLFIPFFIYSFISVLVGFAFLGIGNTIVQVSANPLLVAVVPGNRASSFLSFSQFVKAIGSMIGAPLAVCFAAKFGDWKLLFLVFGVVSVLTVFWLSLTRISESGEATVPASLASSFGLLGNRQDAEEVVRVRDDNDWLSIL